MSKLHEEIVKACDIRGIYGSELTDCDGWRIGRAFGTELIQRGLGRCVVGYDGRLSSPTLAEKVVTGLLDSGIAVLEAGLVPTPLVYHLVARFPADAGVMVTASHNPPEYNGFKFLLQGGLFHGPDIERLARIVESATYVTADRQGTRKRIDMKSRYIEYCLKEAGDSDLKVVWDPGNGAAGVLMVEFLHKLQGEHHLICGAVDGSFPNHHPDPSRPENMQQLSAAVRERGADLGIAFDGDGDRVGVVDNLGRYVTGDRLLMLYARDYLAGNPGAVVMSEVKASNVLYEDIAAHGGIPLMWKVGHANQKEKMLEEGIGLAGETSGHIFFGDNYCYDDALFAAARLLRILAAGGKPLSAHIDAMPAVWNTGELRLQLDKAGRQRLVGAVRKNLAESKRNFSTIDGVRVACGTGYWTLRSSNTQPHITLYCEGYSPEALALCRNDMIRQIERTGIPFVPAAI